MQILDSIGQSGVESGGMDEFVRGLVDERMYDSGLMHISVDRSVDGLILRWIGLMN